MPFLLSSQNVFNYLLAQGLCNQEEQSLSKIELKPAKNFNLLVSLPDGRQLLVKQERLNRDGKTRGEFFDEWQVHNFFQTFPEISHLRSCLSEAIHFDNENSIIVFNYLNDYRDLGEFYGQNNAFPTIISQSIGESLGAIHSLTINRQDYREFFQTSENTINSTTSKMTGGLNRITPEVFGSVPADGLKFFALYQRYDNLGKAIADLSNSFHTCCLTHNDLKLNNILLSLDWEAAIEQKSHLSHSIIRLIDWERGTWGDPASDLGAIIASYLQIWLLSMVTSKTIPIEESLRLAAIPLQLLQPTLSSLVTAYLANFPEIIELRPDFLEIVVQFTGFSLIRSIQARLQHERTFGNSGICILQVAKSLLCRPQASMTTIFGMESSDLISTSGNTNSKFTVRA
ncbi:aminoglycoside phosphotransferase family protein [Sphaerospermopsis aphanizomenoides BCCUSP55]|uniref:phosphotransferase family protein n=1 Tax=Sphaerospermopsis aphanizomenoides TaxID=459663 RepID=UPI001907137F|nr:aminoglycoside phosphotransferase family protein [Sphaerospermopsis aphanizomenoides]MBK1988569.1 aminoglycoside phosphotransferase family protein [Sphaerospermopsis aphanizomenoides BCCUSP55]